MSAQLQTFFQPSTVVLLPHHGSQEHQIVPKLRAVLRRHLGKLFPVLSQMLQPLPVLPQLILQQLQPPLWGEAGGEKHLETELALGSWRKGQLPIQPGQEILPPLLRNGVTLFLQGCAHNLHLILHRPLLGEPGQLRVDLAVPGTPELIGCLENRCRLAREVLDAVRAAVGPRFPIEFRFSGSELFEGGYDLEEGVRIAQALESRIDLLHVSAGTYQRGFGNTHPSMFKEHGCNVYLAAEIKKHVSVPVATLGGLNDPAQMEEIIASGKADVVYMARALLADPELPRKVTENRQEEIVRCLRCFTCMAERAATSTRRCTVNPLIGRELDGVEVQPAPVKKKVLVAGGGPGGLYAAYTAARRGHQVILCEKEPELGGILKSEQAIPFKREMYQLTASYETLARKAGVEIRLNTTVTPEYAEQEGADALIIAVGSTPLIPPIPGLKGENVVVVNNYYREKEKVTDQVVVFGGGLAGCECAVHLGMEGKQVHLVEMRDQLAPDANVRHRPLLLAEIDKYVTVHTGCKGLEVRPDGVLCEDREGRQVLIPGTTVICALGQRSCTDQVNALRDAAPFVRVIGDAARVSTITNAVYWGYHAALDI